MAKSNQRSQSGKKAHALSNDYKIPVKDRKDFLGSRRNKWVAKGKYYDYLSWKKRNNR